MSLLFRVAAVFCCSLVLVESVGATPSFLSVWVDADGSAYLWNPTNEARSFDGYQLASKSESLDPAGWKSIADYVAGGEIADVISALGPDSLTFGEANPGPGNLAELNLGGAGTLQPGAKFAIGKPFKTLPPQADIWHGCPSDCWGERGEIVYVPEPSTRLLATLAGLGLLVVRRSLRSSNRFEGCPSSETE